jgi:hypothetical protein
VLLGVVELMEPLPEELLDPALPLLLAVPGVTEEELGEVELLVPF